MSRLLPDRSKAVRCAGITMLEIAVATSIFGLLIVSGVVAVKRSVIMATSAMATTEKYVVSRQVLDKVEAILSAAGRTTLEYVPDRQVDITQVTSARQIGDYLLPLTDVKTNNIFFRAPRTTAEGETAYRPEFDWYGFYRRVDTTKNAESKRFELVYYDGFKSEVLCRDLRDVSFHYENGICDVTLTLFGDIEEEDDAGGQQQLGQQLGQHQGQQGDTTVSKKKVRTTRSVVIRLL